MQRRWLLLAVIGWAVLWGSLSAVSAAGLTSQDVTRVSQEGSIDVAVVFNSLLQGEIDDILEFEVRIDTHSGDLSALDLSNKVVVWAGGNQADPAGISWEFTSRSSHHPVGILRVKNQAVDGSRLTSGKEDIVLEITDLGGATKRTFTWLVQEKRAYIPNAADGTVSVIAIPEWQVVNTLDVGGEAAHGVAASPDGQIIYVGGRDSGTLYAYGPDGSVIEQVDIDDRLHGVDITKDGQWLFVTGEEKVYALTTDRLEVQEVIDFGEDNPSHVDFSPDGSRAYITNLGGNNVAVVAIPNMEVIKKIPVGQGPNESRVSPDGRRVYVANWESNEVSVIDTELMEVIDSITVGQGTHGVAVSGDGQYIVTANRRTNDISIIDAEELVVIRSINVGEYANHVAFSPDGSYLFVTNQRDNAVVVLDAADFDKIVTITVGAEPHEISFGGF